MKRWELAPKCVVWYILSYSFFNARVIMFYFMTLTNFQSHKVDALKSRKRWELAKNAVYDFYRSWYAPWNGTIVIFYTPWSWPQLLMLNIFLLCIWFKNCAIRRRPLQICLDWLCPRHGVALVILVETVYEMLSFQMRNSASRHTANQLSANLHKAKRFSANRHSANRLS